VSGAGGGSVGGGRGGEGGWVGGPRVGEGPGGMERDRRGGGVMDFALSEFAVDLEGGGTDKSNPDRGGGDNRHGLPILRHDPPVGEGEWEGFRTDPAADQGRRGVEGEGCR